MHVGPGLRVRCRLLCRARVYRMHDVCSDRMPPQSACRWTSLCDWRCTTHHIVTLVTRQMLVTSLR